MTIIQNHRLTNGNIMLGLEELMGSEKADIFYSDPPWGQGNLNYWQTLNKRHNNVEADIIDYNAFLHQIFKLAADYTKGMIFIEYGMKWKQDIINFGTSYGLEHIGFAQIKYKSGNKFLPYHIHFFTNNGSWLPAGLLESVSGHTGMECLDIAVGPFTKPGGIILDPCCGEGMTARFAIHSKMNLRGNEINAKRLSKTIDWLQKHV